MLQSFSCVLTWGVAFISMWVWGWCMFSLFSRALLCETAFWCVSSIAVLLQEKVVPDLRQLPTFVCFEPGFHCLYLMATASQDRSCWYLAVFSMDLRCYTSCSLSAVLTPFQVGQSQLKQLCSFLWSLSLLFTQPFLIFNLDITTPWNEETRTICSSQNAGEPDICITTFFLFSGFFLFS